LHTSESLDGGDRVPCQIVGMARWKREEREEFHRSGEPDTSDRAGLVGSGVHTDTESDG
jgi:hypothetical protein